MLAPRMRYGELSVTGRREQQECKSYENPCGSHRPSLRCRGDPSVRSMFHTWRTSPGRLRLTLAEDPRDDDIPPAIRHRTASTSGFSSADASSSQTFHPDRRQPAIAESGGPGPSGSMTTAPSLAKKWLKRSNGAPTPIVLVVGRRRVEGQFVRWADGGDLPAGWLRHYLRLRFAPGGQNAPFEHERVAIVFGGVIFGPMGRRLLLPTWAKRTHSGADESRSPSNE